MRKFEKVSKNEFLKYQNEESYNEIILPKRQTEKSAGYDFYLPYNVLFEKGKVTKVYTGVKVQMNDDEFLGMFIRSSVGGKLNLNLANQVGIIDSDYYNNESNEGHIIISVRNLNDFDVFMKKGERISQGIFMKFYTSCDDDASGVRSGGLGSTKK